MTDPHTPDVEDRLRAALAERANRVDPSSDGLSRIEEQLMATSSKRRTVLVGGALAAAAAVLVAVAFVVADDDDGAVVTDTTDVTSSETTDTTSTSTTTTTTTTTPTVDPYTVAYPEPGTAQFSDPAEVAERYAVDVLGFTALVVGDYRAGDNRSGEIPVSDRADGPETTILVRQMDDDAWYVLGSATTDIVVDTPTAGAALTSPFETTGSALAFEGTVNIAVLLQSDGSEVGAGFVTGSGVPPAGPFEGEVTFSAPAGETPGVLVYRTLSANDGHVEQATSFPVRLQG